MPSRLTRALRCACQTDGRPLALLFEVLPSKKELPIYYQVVEQPMDLCTLGDNPRAVRTPSVHARLGERFVSRSAVCW